DLDVVAAGDVFCNLVEFPYPSASGLHIGHVFKYSGADAYGRHQRMRGKAVFQPMGFDAFGIHTENFALRTGQHPRVNEPPPEGSLGIVISLEPSNTTPLTSAGASRPARGSTRNRAGTPAPGASAAHGAPTA